MTQTTTRPKTVVEAIGYYGRSEKTIRRWIRDKKVRAEKQEDGNWLIYPDPDNDPVKVRTPPPQDHPDDPDDRDKNTELELLKLENKMLRERIADKDAQIHRLDTHNDQLRTLIGIVEKQIDEAPKQLPPPPQKPSLIQRIRRTLTGNDDDNFSIDP